MSDVRFTFDQKAIARAVEKGLESQYTSFAKREPAVLTGLVTGPVAGAFAGLATSGVITSAQASTLTSTLVGVAVTLVMAVQGFVIRRFVTPAWKRIEASNTVPVVVDPPTNPPAAPPTATTPAAEPQP